VIDALPVDWAYQEDVGDSMAVSIALVVDLGPLTHKQGINDLLDVNEEALDWNHESNNIDNDGDGDWKTDSETELESDKYISEPDSSK
jgi:hypothetical protein